MDRRTLAFSIALAYPEYAFAAEDPVVIGQSQNLIDRAGHDDDISADLRDLLRQHQHLNEWVEQLLEDDELVPPHLQPDTVRSFQPMPGPGGPIRAPKYQCPAGDGFTWYQSSVARPVPSCAICQAPLKLA
jgi:hypothetical protein